MRLNHHAALERPSERNNIHSSKNRAARCDAGPAHSTAMGTGQWAAPPIMQAVPSLLFAVVSRERSVRSKKQRLSFAL
ncbi:hypothetical protein [Olivibacter sitiensis]|uniref:hypothetical protein n=1 Tax=Olivibacter sitiensis TaxID=376470 RepID=UPI0012FC9FB2|nr:hypothetical protein [Olivibacter sitiensis]